MSDGSPASQSRLTGTFGCALTIDVEEWYHTCLIREYVDPKLRPALADELDRLLPEILELLDRVQATATFFVLGEVAARLPARVREIASAGHEIGSHAYLHYRAEWHRLAAWRQDVARCKAVLEDIVSEPVTGFRSPEWSLRRVSNPRLEHLAELGFLYDSSLTPCWGSGDRSNPSWATRFNWSSGRTLVEFPPLTHSGRLQLPIGGWTGRLLPPKRVADVAERHRRRGGLPVLVVHPWELSGRPTPGVLTGLARFMHEAARLSFRARFEELADLLPMQSIAGAAGALLRPSIGTDAGLPSTMELSRPFVENKP